MSDATDPSDPLIRQLTTIAACAAELVGLVADIRHAVVQTVPALQRVAKGIEERTAVAKAASERSDDLMSAYLAALRRLEDDSGPVPVPSPIDDDDGSH